MPIDPTFAGYSDLAFRSAVAVYVLTLVLLVVQFALTRKPAERRELAVAGVSATGDHGSTVGPGRVTEESNRPLAERIGNMAFSVLLVAAALHVVAIVLRGVATGRFPLGNMYEFVTMATAAAVMVGVVFLRAQKYRTIWVFLLVPILILLFLAGTVLYADAAPVVPALRSYWLPLHVTIVSVGSGIFLVSGVASLLFLFQTWHSDGPKPAWVTALANRLPDAATLDQLAYRTTVIGFPLFGAGVVLGAIWAEAAWGRFWGWDPKETCSFIAWVLYAAYLHARATSGWRERRAAWINIAGFVAMLFNLFIINIVISGLHSYAGLN